MIFIIGIGMEMLLLVLEKIGLKEEFLVVVYEVNIGCRGYKIYVVLKKFGVMLYVLDEDGMIRGLICFLEWFELKDKKVMI